MPTRTKGDQVKEWLLVALILFLFRMALLSAGMGIMPIPFVDDYAQGAVNFLERLAKIAQHS